MRMPNVLLAVLILLAFSAPPTWAGQGGRITADQAGQIASGQTGGRVLAVKPADGGYRVKVLTPGGQVRYVFVPSN